LFCDWKLFRTMDWTQKSTTCVPDLCPADYTTTTTTTTTICKHHTSINDFAPKKHIQNFQLNA